MNLFLTIAFLFFIGSMAGWVIEVVFRRFFSSANPERKWINPGVPFGTLFAFVRIQPVRTVPAFAAGTIYQSRIRHSGRRRCSP